MLADGTGLFGFGVLKFPQKCFQSRGPSVKMRPIDSDPRLHLDRAMLSRMASDMNVDLSKIDIMVTDELPENTYGMFWAKGDRQVILLNAKHASENTVAHEMFHAHQLQSWFYRPFRLGYEAYAARAGDAYEWKYRGILTRT